ncbi:putative RNA polymerase sigma factor [Vibrio virus VPMCC5]|uniref:RNA polymerase sigma factor n=1 Tax=Salmonella enterica TaxID=28901 RepID=UPI0030E1A306|nr:putative RNA polymerase sigma factor [Vibrio virus VPMCC5]
MNLFLDKWEVVDESTLSGRKKLKVIAYDPEFDTSSTSVGFKELLEDAREYMSKLAPRTARICHLYYTVGHTMADIAESENVSVKTVEKTLNKVSKQLRERYGN